VSTAPDWITPEDVAGYLDLPTADGDDNLTLSTAAVKAAVEGRRADLWDRTVDPAVFLPPDHVRTGAIIWAGLVYQTRNAPSGFAGYGDETWVIDSLGSRRSEVMRLIGWRRPELA
jgi:hypothetical protein